jgi:hypothetical protein
MLACGAVAVSMIRGTATFQTKDVDVSNGGAEENAPVETHDLEPGRPVYQYSVIPGGAFDASELAEAMDRDPVVAAAYRTVADGVHAEVVPADRLAYMSYRLGDHIFWTRHPIRLHRGETILTNGTVELRGRCGNGISPDPVLPTIESEPGPLELEALVAPDSPLPSHPLAFNYAASGDLYAAPGGFPLGAGPNGVLGSNVAPGGWIGQAEPASGSDDAPATPPVDSLPPLLDIGTPGRLSPPASDQLGFVLPPGFTEVGGVITVLPIVPGGLDSYSLTAGDLGQDGVYIGSPSGEPMPEVPAPLPAPEPGTFLLIGGGLIGIAVRKKRTQG